MLKFFYKNFIGRRLRLPFACRWLSKLGGFFADRSVSRFFIKSFIKRNKIDMAEFEIPAEGFKSFNEFFYRKLKPNKRFIDQNPSTVVSPADSRLFVVSEINPQAYFFVKACRFNLEAFLQDKSLAQDFAGGSLFLFRLAPADYHRFHFPFDCVASKPKIINGKFESVNPIAYQSGVQPLIENERHLITLDSEKFGKAIFVPVGAMLVGNIAYSYQPDLFYKKSDEMGHFAFGGSSIVMIFKKGVVAPNHEFIQNSLHDKESGVKMGQKVAKQRAVYASRCH